VIEMATPQNKDAEYAELSHIFAPKSVAIIGASDKPGKVGHVIMQNYLDIGFTGKLYPVNINTTGKIMGRQAYKNVSEIKKPIDLAVISVPAEAVPKALEECGKVGVRGAVIVSSGFAEVGKVDLQDSLVRIAKKYKMPVVGPNCLGVMDLISRCDTLFLPTFKIDRPKIGGVSFVSQSGSVGSSILDLISSEGFGLAKFISYGNAAVVDEVDILNFLAHDDDTKVILFYLEGVRRGREFMKVAKEASKRKPVVIIKGGVTSEGAGAAHSHTASLAGSAEAYDAVFRQCGIIIARDLEDLLYFGKIFDTQPLSIGTRIAVITNGGGHGVLATDALYQNGLTLPVLSKKSETTLRKSMPPIVNVKMPLDVGGDADYIRFSAALDVITADPGVDAIMLITLFQTPGADEKLADVAIQCSGKKLKPLVVVSTGGKYTRSHTSIMEESGVPVYESPTIAARALKALADYSAYRKEVD
jgi:acetyl coenzyme A synthetase (ADP forming)-like protein